MTHEADSAELERLLAQEGWLRSLARALVSDAATADDVAQETWLRVLQRRTRTIESPRAWLARVARRAAGERRRDERARELRERAAARTESVDDEAWAERVELAARWQKRVAAAVLTLSEPSRSTVVLRYFEGRSAAQIARETGAPESTVRNRPRRALVELRAALDRESQGDRSRWHAALAPLTKGQLESAGKGLLLMGSTAKLVAAVCVAAVVVLPFFFQAENARNVDAARPVAESLPDLRLSTPLAPQAVRTAKVVDTQRTVEPPVRVAPLEEPALVALPRGMVEVLVVQQSSDGAHEVGLPLTRGRVWIAVEGGFLPRELDEPSAAALSADLDERGIATFVDVSPGHHSVGVCDAGFGLLQSFVVVRDKEGARVVLRLGSSTLHGVVYDHAGSRVAGARVQLSGPTQSNKQMHAVLWTDAEGRYEASHLLAGEHSASVDFSGWQNSQGGEYMTSVELEPNETREFDFGESRGLPLLEGVVRTLSGEPAEQYTSSGRSGKIHFERTDLRGYRSVSWSADGAYSARLEPGVYDVSISFPGRDERMMCEKGLVIEADAWRVGPALVRDLTAPGTTVSGFVDRGRWISVRAAQDARPLASIARPPDGAYRFDGLPPGRWLLSDGERSVEFEIVDRAASVVVDLR